MLRAAIKKRLGEGTDHVLNIDVELCVRNGTTVLFGASGAGKSTILRAIGGITAPDEGNIRLGETVFFDSALGINLPIQARRIGYVFQDHCLFPHLTAGENIAFGARTSRESPAGARVRELLSLLRIEQTAGRYPRDLSGGEQQRVALARALASDPCIMLLDEPLSAVDVATRSILLEAIAAVQRRWGIPFLYVTHNYSEAAHIGDTMYVLDDGKVVQEGAPLEILNAPRTLPAARAVGTENIFVGRIAGHKQVDGISTIELERCQLEAPYNALPVGNHVAFGIRSEDIILACERLTQTSARNVLEGMIKNVICDTDKTELVVDCGVDFKVSITAATIRALGLRPGTRVYLLIKARAIHLLG